MEIKNVDGENESSCSWSIVARTYLSLRSRAIFLPGRKLRLSENILHPKSIQIYLAAIYTFVFSFLSSADDWNLEIKNATMEDDDEYEWDAN